MQSKHWTEDPELLERYTLKRVPESERAQLEEHLHSCAECRERIADETKIVEGIRTFGRTELKARLNNKLAKEPVRQIPWMRIMSAAATIVVIAGIGFFNEWFPPSKKEMEPKPAETQGETKASPERAVAQKRELSDLEKNREKDASSGGTTGKETRPSQKIQLNGAKREDRPALSFAPQSGAAAARERALSLDEMKDQKVGQADDQVWVEGTVIEQADKMEEFRGARRIKKEGEAQVSKVGVQRAPQGVQLQQMSSSVLPPAQQQKQKFSNVNSIQTLVSRTNEGLKMTLYLDSLMQEADFQNASVRELEPDSIVIDLPNKRIGYQLPSGWNKQAVKTKR